MCEVVKEGHIIPCEQLASLLCFLMDNTRQANTLFHEVE